MSQRTLWEEGSRPGSQVAAVSAGAALLAVLANLLVAGQITLFFDVAFVVICVAAALSIRARDFFVAGVLPPLLMLGVVATLALLVRGAIAEQGDGLIQAVVSGLAHHAGALVVGYGLTLAILALRQMASEQRLPAQTARGRRRTETAVPDSPRRSVPTA